ncbi:MAG: PDZ domain-containing protein [Gammaproteobacteria bacterium]|nr:PDZ domain-containing protein [Gammaproteobacteria bacterium]
MQAPVHQLALRLVEPIKLLVIIGIAYTLASSGWYFLSEPVPANLGAASPRTTATPSATLPLADIVAAHLFGIADQAPSAPVSFDAPETNLKLTLEGVFRADVPEQSAAIIALQGRPGELFTVGGKVSAGVELAEVHADRVVLRRGGMFETLRFPEQPGLLAGGVDESMLPTGDTYIEEPVYDQPVETQEYLESSQIDSPDPGAQLRDGIASYRERLSNDPQGTLNSLGLSSVNAAGSEGYRLGDLAQSPYLAQTGLQPGDVVLSVNGRPVGNVQQDQLEIDNIMAQGSARLEVQRGDRRFFVTASLK